MTLLFCPVPAAPLALVLLAHSCRLPYSLKIISQFIIYISRSGHLLHATAADREDNRFRKGLPALPKGSLNTHTCALLATRLTRGWQGTSGVCRPRVKVEVVLGLLDSAGRGVRRIHKRLGDLGQSKVLVRWQKVFNAFEKASDIGTQASFLEFIGHA